MRVTLFYSSNTASPTDSPSVGHIVKDETCVS